MSIDLKNKIVNDKWLMLNGHHANLYLAISNNAGNSTTTASEDDDLNLSSNDTNIAFILVNGALIKGVSDEDAKKFNICNIDYISAALDEAITDESITAICMVFDSPGGSVPGIPELARKIASYKAIKPIYGYTENMACSAAYWLLSQCTSVAMTPTAIVGSIGVYSIFENVSEALNKAGIKIEAFSSGKYKLMGHPAIDMTDDEKKLIQDDVNSIHDDFKNAVKSTRNVDDLYMEGLTYSGNDALKANLVDMVVDDIYPYLTSAITNNET